MSLLIMFSYRFLELLPVELLRSDLRSVISEAKRKERLRKSTANSSKDLRGCGNLNAEWPLVKRLQHANLSQLTDAVHMLLGQPDIIETVDRLKKDVRICEGPFVWSVINPRVEILQWLPSHIKSVWIFVLKKDTRSICHFHPNSIQHMVLVEGRGSSEIGGIRRAMRRYDSSPVLEDVWTIIDKNVPHEFFPEETNMVVLSFHTCIAENLIEIECVTGRQRRYEMLSNT